MLFRSTANCEQWQTLLYSYISTVSQQRQMHDFDKSRADAGMAARCRCKFRYLSSKFTAAARGFYCDSNAFELNSSINHGKITVLNISIHYLIHIVCALNITDRQNAEIVHSTTLCKPIARLHCRPNRTVKCSTFLSSFGTKISHVSFFHSNSRNNVLPTTKIATNRRLTKGASRRGHNTFAM